MPPTPCRSAPRANINCRIFPGTSREEVRQTLVEIVADPEVKVTMPEVRSAAAAPPPLDPQVMGPLETVAAEDVARRPGGAASCRPARTDGAFLTPAGIPTYGISGMFLEPDLGGIHGLNEKAASPRSTRAATISSS